MFKIYSSSPAFDDCVFERRITMHSIVMYMIMYTVCWQHLHFVWRRRGVMSLSGLGTSENSRGIQFEIIPVRHAYDTACLWAAKVVKNKLFTRRAFPRGIWTDGRTDGFLSIFSVPNKRLYTRFVNVRRFPPSGKSSLDNNNVPAGLFFFSVRRARTDVHFGGDYNTDDTILYSCDGAVARAGYYWLFARLH